jgi:hypothetical protein
MTATVYYLQRGYKNGNKDKHEQQAYSIFPGFRHHISSAQPENLLSGFGFIKTIYKWSSETALANQFPGSPIRQRVFASVRFFPRNPSLIRQRKLTLYWEKHAKTPGISGKRSVLFHKVKTEIDREVPPIFLRRERRNISGNRQLLR